MAACSKSPSPPQEQSPVQPVTPVSATEPDGTLKVVRELSDLAPAPSLPAWSPDGNRILYEGGPNGQPTVATVAGQEPPLAPVGLRTFVPPVWAPDGKGVVFAGARQEVDGSTATTLYLQPVAGGNPVDLLPGALAKQSVSGTKFPRRFVSPTMLAYEEHMGSGIQELRLVDIASHKPVALPQPLQATFFTWSPDGALVAGQIYGGPADFWVWDMAAQQFLKKANPAPSPYQFFEGWAGPGTALFTRWEKYPYDQEALTASLYALDVGSGKETRVADDGVLAGGTGEHITYVKLKPRPTLVVADKTGKPLWQEDLGALPPGPALWEYRPHLTDQYVAYRLFPEEWKISPLGEHKPVTVSKGLPATAGFSPDGRHVAVLLLDAPARLQILLNPFEAQ